MPGLNRKFGKVAAKISNGGGGDHSNVDRSTVGCDDGGSKEGCGRSEGGGFFSCFSSGGRSK